MLSLRRFSVLFYCLPDESITFRKVHGWSFNQQVAVLTLERVDMVAGQLNHLRHEIHGKKAPRWKALHIPRPEQNSPPPKRLSIAEFRDLVEDKGTG